MTYRCLITTCAIFTASCSANAEFILSFSDADFVETDTFNEINQFSIDISVADNLVAGGVYTDPIINSVDYRIGGILALATPSGFPGFLLIRSMTGTEFYAQSPESGLDFSITASADLSDGLQVSELMGMGTVFTFNARELNQAPGRYHPPIFTLNSDGTGQLLNANNMSTFPNPPPPTGSGLLVNVTPGEEYISDLGFNTSLTIATAVPEPSSCLLLALGTGTMLYRRRRRACVRSSVTG